MIRALILLMAGVLGCSQLAAQPGKVPAKYRKIQRYLDQATREKLTGVVVLISDPKSGVWTAASGYANFEKKEPMTVDRMFSLASIGKMYNAVAVMKLAEDGKIRLDDVITKHLPGDIADGLPNADRVTIRHLLGHTSGFFNYENDPELTGLFFAGKLKLDTFPRAQVLRKYVFGKDPLCQPGREFHYSSTNYLLLAMIVDGVVPEGHSEYLRQIFRDRGLTNTTYRKTPISGNVNYYGDLNQDGDIENLSEQTFETTNWFTGDDGVYASIQDAHTFISDLMEGRILTLASLSQMQTWNNDSKPDYGLGLMADKSFPYKLLMGHSGRGIGVTTDLYYFPKQKRVVGIFCNTGLRGASPEFRKTYNKMRTRIVKKLFLF